MKLLFAGLLLGASIITQAKCTLSAEPSPDIPSLIQQLRDSDLDHRRDAARELSKISSLPPEGINVMASLLEQPNQDYVIQNSAFEVLCKDGVSAVSVATRSRAFRAGLVEPALRGRATCANLVAKRSISAESFITAACSTCVD
jgi:hypothetical protein